jgi:transcription elongation GreA/GreB family factor
MNEDKEPRTSDPVALLRRCVQPLQAALDDMRNEQAGYEGYPMRQARYGLAILEMEKLLAEVQAASAADETPEQPRVAFAKWVESEIVHGSGGQPVGIISTPDKSSPD